MKISERRHFILNIIRETIYLTNILNILGFKKIKNVYVLNIVKVMV